MATSGLRPWQWFLIILAVVIAVIIIAGFIPISSGGSVTNG